MLEIQDTIEIEHEGVKFCFKNNDIFDLIEAEDLAKNSLAEYYMFFLKQLISVDGIKDGALDVSVEDLKTRKIKLPYPFLVAVIGKYKTKILTGKESVDKDLEEKNA